MITGESVMSAQGHGHHLLLPAAQRAGCLLEPVSEDREGVGEQVDGVGPVAPGEHGEVLADGQLREDLAGPGE